MIHENLLRLWLILEREIEDSTPGTIAHCLSEIQSCDLLSYDVAHVSSLAYYLDQEAGAGRRAMQELAIGAVCRFGQSCQWYSNKHTQCRCFNSTPLGLACVAGIAGDMCGSADYNKEACWYFGMHRACNQGTDDQLWRPLASKFVESVCADMQSWSISHVELHRAMALGALAQLLLVKTRDIKYVHVFNDSLTAIDKAAEEADNDDARESVCIRAIAQQIRECVTMLKN